MSREGGLRKNENPASLFRCGAPLALRPATKTLLLTNWDEKQVLVNWILVPAASIMELIGDALKIIVLEAGRPEDAEDTVLIRTLRPVAAVRTFSRTLLSPDRSRLA